MCAQLKYNPPPPFPSLLSYLQKFKSGVQKTHKGGGGTSMISTNVVMNESCTQKGNNFFNIATINLNKH